MRLLLIGLILLAFPVLEIWLLIKLADQYGWWFFGYLVLVAMLGWRLIQDEKTLLLGRMVQNLGQGGTPTTAIFGGAKNMLAGILLIIPGVITDAIALILLLLPTSNTMPNPRQARSSKAANDDVIEGEFYRED